MRSTPRGLTPRGHSEEDVSSADKEQDAAQSTAAMSADGPSRAHPLLAGAYCAFNIVVAGNTSWLCKCPRDARNPE